MNINYNRLFNLCIGHDYFTDGYDRFVRLSLTTETETLLKNGKMLFKRLPHGITVLYKATDDEVTPFVAFEGDQHFEFAMYSDNPAGLMNITDLDESPGRPYKASNILYFKNDPARASANSNNPEIITHTLIDTLRAKLFTYSFALSGNPATALMRVTDAQGNPVSIGNEANGTPFPTTLTLSINSDNGFSQQVDLRNKQIGRYSITILNSAGTSTLLEEELYVDDSLPQHNILGIVDLVYTSASGHIYGDTEEYRLQFKRTETNWKYFVVNKRANIDFNTESLFITDAGSPNGTRYITNQFTRAYAGIKITADAAGTTGNSITLAYSGGGAYPALTLSGKTLAGGAAGVKAQGTITIINNTVSGYTVTINGVDFTEGTDFNNGGTPDDTAGNLISAINENGAVNITSAALGYDILISDLPALVFSSQQGIPFFKKPKRDIRLRKQSDGQTIIPNLPNPSHKGIQKQFAGNSESEVYIFI